MCGVSFSCPLVYIPILHQCHTIFITVTSFAKARAPILFSFFKPVFSSGWLLVFHVYLEPIKFCEILPECNESVDHFLENEYLKNLVSSKHECAISLWFILSYFTISMILMFFFKFHFLTIIIYIEIWLMFQLILCSENLTITNCNNWSAGSWLFLLYIMSWIFTVLFPLSLSYTFYFYCLFNCSG